MFRLILIRLHNSKTDTLTMRFVRLYHFMCARDKQGLGVDFVLKIPEAIQEGCVH